MAQAMIMRRGGGGSAKLNVVGGTTQPTSPKPNTVWINTSTALAKLALQATAPTAMDGQALAAGDIWLQTVIASNVHVIVAHKGLAYYVGYAWMYSGSAWVRATARYYDTAWHDISGLWLKDTFTRANNASLGAAESGQTWQQTTAGAWQVSGNAALHANTSDAAFYLTNAPLNAVLTYTYPAGGSWGPKIRLRGTGANAGGLFISHSHTTAGGTGYINASIGASYLVVNNACAVGSTVKVEIYDETADVNTRIRIYVNGALTVNYLYEGAYLSGTYVSFGGGNVGAQFDNITLEKVA